MIKVTLPYDDKWLALAWAKEHCASYITNSKSDRKGEIISYFSRKVYIDYFFSDEKDATMFALKWL